MIINEIYKYARPDGGISVSLVKPGENYVTLYRIVAEEGKMLKNTISGIICNSADTATINEWEEIDEIIAETILPLPEENRDVRMLVYEKRLLENRLKNITIPSEEVEKTISEIESII